MSDRIPELDDFVRLVGNVVGVRTATAESNFFDLGGDSLTAAHLSILVEERWGLSMDVFAVITADTLGEVYDDLVGSVPGSDGIPTLDQARPIAG